MLRLTANISEGLDHVMNRSGLSGKPPVRRAPRVGSAFGLAARGPQRAPMAPALSVFGR